MCGEQLCFALIKISCKLEEMLLCLQLALECISCFIYCLYTVVQYFSLSVTECCDAWRGIIMIQKALPDTISSLISPNGYIYVFSSAFYLSIYGSLVVYYAILVTWTPAWNKFIYTYERDHHWFILWVIAWLGPNHHINWLIFNWDIGITFRWSQIQNANVFWEIAFEYIVCKSGAGLIVLFHYYMHLDNKGRVTNMGPTWSGT